MLEKMNHADIELFTSAFLSEYKSPGVNIKLQKKAYNTQYEVIELKRSYKVKIKEKIKRFSNIFSVAEFIFNNTFDQRFVCIANLKLKHLNQLGYSKDLMKKIIGSVYGYQQVL